MLSRTGAAKNVHTSDDKNGWISVDVAMWVIPTHYTLRHSRGFGRSALRNWLFQVLCCDWVEQGHVVCTTACDRLILQLENKYHSQELDYTLDRILDYIVL